MITYKFKLYTYPQSQEENLVYVELEEDDFNGLGEFKYYRVKVKNNTYELESININDVPENLRVQDLASISVEEDANQENNIKKNIVAQLKNLFEPSLRQKTAPQAPIEQKTEKSLPARFMFMSGHIAVDSYQTRCKKNGFSTNQTFFIFAGNEDHHRNQKGHRVAFSDVKTGGGLAAVAGELGRAKIFTLSLPTRNLRLIKEELFEKLPTEAIQDLYRMQGFAPDFVPVLPVREKKHALSIYRFPEDKAEISDEELKTFLDKQETKAPCLIVKNDSFYIYGRKASEGIATLQLLPEDEGEALAKKFSHNSLQYFRYGIQEEKRFYDIVEKYHPGYFAPEDYFLGEKGECWEPNFWGQNQLASNPQLAKKYFEALKAFHKFVLSGNLDDCPDEYKKYYLEGQEEAKKSEEMRSSPYKSVSQKKEKEVFDKTKLPFIKEAMGRLKNITLDDSNNWHEGLIKSLDDLADWNVNLPDENQMKAWGKVTKVYSERIVGLTDWTSRHTFFGIAGHKRSDAVDLLYRSVSNFDTLYTLSEKKVTNLEQCVQMEMKLNFVEFIDTEIERLKSVFASLGNADPAIKILAYTTLKEAIRSSLKTEDGLKKSLEEIVESLKNTKVTLPEKEGSSMVAFQTIDEAISWNRGSGDKTSVTSRRNFDQKMKVLVEARADCFKLLNIPQNPEKKAQNVLGGP